jgi:hypothetical protein
MRVLMLVTVVLLAQAVNGQSPLIAPVPLPCNSIGT